MTVLAHYRNVPAPFRGLSVALGNFDGVHAGHRAVDGGIVGEATLDFVKQFRLDFGILGISGIDLDGSLLDFDYHEVRVKKVIIENSRSVFLAVDHSKFGRNAMVKLGNISQLHMLFTDKQPPKEICSILDEHSIPLQVTSKHN